MYSRLSTNTATRLKANRARLTLRRTGGYLVVHFPRRLFVAPLVRSTEAPEPRIRVS